MQYARLSPIETYYYELQSVRIIIIIIILCRLPVFRFILHNDKVIIIILGSIVQCSVHNNICCEITSTKTHYRVSLDGSRKTHSCFRRLVLDRKCIIKCIILLNSLGTVGIELNKITEIMTILIIKVICSTTCYRHSYSFSTYLLLCFLCLRRYNYTHHIITTYK